MKNATKKRQRAVAHPKNNVGQVRYELFSQVFSQIKAAREQGFYIEAIALVDSLVTDRLESRLSRLLGQDISFKTLGSVITKANMHEVDEQLKSTISSRLDHWRKERNAALHEMAKLADGDYKTWSDRYKALCPVCEEGIQILRLIDNRCKKLGRQR